MGFYDEIPSSTANEDSQVVVSGHKYLSGEMYASWPRRAAAFLIDAWPLYLLWFLSAIDGWMPQVIRTFAALFCWIALVATMAGIGHTDLYGRTEGQKLLRIVVLRPIVTPQGAHWMWTRLTPPVAVLRILLHILDCIPAGIGWYRPLWNRYHQTFADSLTGTVVMYAPDPATFDISKPIPGVWVTKVNG